MSEQPRITGTAGPFRLNAIRKAVWECNAAGMRVTLDVGPGLIFRPIQITGDLHALRQLAAWLTGEKTHDA